MPSIWTDVAFGPEENYKSSLKNVFQSRENNRNGTAFQNKGDYLEAENSFKIYYMDSDLYISTEM